MTAWLWAGAILLGGLGATTVLVVALARAADRPRPRPPLHRAIPTPSTTTIDEEYRQ